MKLSGNRFALSLASQIKKPSKILSQRIPPLRLNNGFHSENQISPRVLQIEHVAGKNLGEYCDLSKDGTGVFAKGGNQGYLICQTADKIEGHPIRFFESQATLQKRLAGSGWKLLDTAPWHSGDLLKLSKPAGTAKKTVQPGFYFLGSISNNTTVNLNACFGGDVPQGISLKALWQAELRPV